MYTSYFDIAVVKSIVFFKQIACMQFKKKKNNVESINGIYAAAQHRLMKREQEQARLNKNFRIY